MRIYTLLILGISGWLTNATVSARSKPRSFLVALPLTMGSPLKVAYNYERKVALSLNLTSQGERERLSDREIEDAPGASLKTRSTEVSFMFSRYTRPENMSGWHWGLGAGYKRLKADWIKNPDNRSSDDLVLDENGRTNYNLDVAGISANFRTGYRYVANDLGFAASIFLLIKHFQNKVQDSGDEVEGRRFAEVTRTDSEILRRRLTTRVLPGIEIGWAF